MGLRRGRRNCPFSQRIIGQILLWELSENLANQSVSAIYIVGYSKADLVRIKSAKGRERAGKSNKEWPATAIAAVEKVNQIGKTVMNFMLHIMLYVE